MRFDFIFQETMNIKTKPGEKIVFQFPKNGRQSDIEHAAEYLELGKEYTLEDIYVHQSCTDVYLKEVPGVKFNSVHFSNVKGVRV